jgi:hypothetical protein
MFAVAEPPAELMVNPLDGGVIVTVDPVPFNAADSGEPEALSVTVTVPVRFPPVVGVKVTEIVQLAPAATLLPHVFVSAKFAEAVIEVIESGATPEFVNVIVCAALIEPSVSAAKVRLVGESATAGAAAVPVPLSETV